MTDYQRLLDLYASADPFILANAWNAQSAQIYEQVGYAVVGTSSSAVATAMGYEDGEEISFDSLFEVVSQIKRVVKVPLSVDLERGYADDAQGIADNLARLAELGVAGVNLEDSIGDNELQLDDRDRFGTKLSAIREALDKRGISIFLNIRTDAFLVGLPNALEETLSRLTMYEAAGAEGLFVPYLKNPEEIRAVVNESKLPLNLLAMQELPDFPTLKDLGVKRISLGGGMYKAVMNDLRHRASRMLEESSLEELYR